MSQVKGWKGGETALPRIRGWVDEARARIVGAKAGEVGRAAGRRRRPGARSPEGFGLVLRTGSH